MFALLMIFHVFHQEGGKYHQFKACSEKKIFSNKKQHKDGQHGEKNKRRKDKTHGTEVEQKFDDHHLEQAMVKGGYMAKDVSFVNCVIVTERYPI